MSVNRGGFPPTRDEQDWDPQPEDEPSSGNTLRAIGIAVIILVGAALYGMFQSFEADLKKADEATISAGQKR